MESTICFVFVALLFVPQKKQNKISFEISQEVSFDAFASLRSRVFTLRVENKVECGYLEITQVGMVL